jgi:hypothetical protein
MVSRDPRVLRVCCQTAFVAKEFRSNSGQLTKDMSQNEPIRILCSPRDGTWSISCYAIFGWAWIGGRILISVSGATTAVARTEITQVS